MSESGRGTRPLVISDPTLLVRRANERLVMMREGREVAAVPIADVSHVALHGPVTLTGAALAGLLDEGIELTLYSSAGFYRGSVTSSRAKNVYLMLAQVDAWRRDERRLALAKSLLAGKIAGQRAMLQRHALSRGSERCREAADRLRIFERDIAEEGDVDAVRGVEGSAAAQYFGAFGEMLAEGWSWEGRRHHPATDPVNALLSFGYTLLTGEMVRLLTLGGFDTRVGFIHGLRYGRDSLALDLVEEFRAPLVDRFVLRVINLRQFAPSDFDEHDGGAVKLNNPSRRRFLELWEETLNGRAPALRNEVRDEAHASRAPVRIAREGSDAREEDADEEAPRWRRRMELQVDRLRNFLMKGEEYVPLTRTLRPASRRGGARGGEGEDGGEVGGESAPWDP